MPLFACFESDSRGRHCRDVDFEDRPLQNQRQHQAHVDDITLRTADDFQLGVDDAFDIGPSDGIGSQDFNDLDLGIDWDGEPNNGANDREDLMSVDGSVGVGRDAQIGRDSLGPLSIHGNGSEGDFDAVSRRSKSREVSDVPLDMVMDIDLPDLSVDLAELGVGFDEIPSVGSPPVEIQSSRACA
jgi:cohesin complex subunit SCC1